MTNGNVAERDSRMFRIDRSRTQGVVMSRLLAYVVDVVMIFIWSLLVSAAILMLGVVTFGFGWMLFAFVPLTAIAYNAITIGGPSQATVGMRFAGLQVLDAFDGGRPTWLAAAVHALLFYVALTTFLLWLADILFGLVREDGRFGHDLLTGLLVVRRD